MWRPRCVLSRRWNPPSDSRNMRLTELTVSTTHVKGKGNRRCFSASHEGIAPLILSLDTRWRWVISFMPRPHHLPGETASGILWTGVWVGLRARLEVLKYRKFSSVSGLGPRYLGCPPRSLIAILCYLGFRTACRITWYAMMLAHLELEYRDVWGGSGLVQGTPR
jgi:hypothetical protein